MLDIAVSRPCTVEIKEPRDTLALTRRVNGVKLDVVDDPNFAALKRGQTIPWGSIRASGDEGVRISYRVRTGRDVTGDPEF
ncbi:hypothetical protein AQJ84_27145 [Streptomyces resistomycificus]|uniref:Uncharacterized protein n=1 Tax=Streptomyces resistomycificus TaxID=67356 RepID=A0A0L8KSG2_9ACTN|nr:hypothetical protein ADK37_38170 [Streptomyces resistomycificus]KUN94360.1 hypothetical protein AQJ84_27145 [Streptomyces resistomycificus]